MTNFYSEVSKLRNSIENGIIDTMVQNGLAEFHFERPLKVTNNEYTANVFPIDEVTDLKTNIWHGEWV